MKVKIHRQGGYSSGNITEERGDLYGSVTLHQDPVLDLQAANANYVDQKAASVPAGRFATGVIPKEALPVLTGDVIKPEGTDTIAIAPTGIPNNSTHSKVTINSKGQVIGSGVFIETDIPNLPFDKLTNTPTTLEGYGVSDALPLTGGEMQGVLQVTEVGTDDNALANLAFLDSQSGGSVSSGVNVGGIIYRNSPITPAGFLKCNGGELSKTTYANLYNVIGDTFSGSTKILYGGEAGKPWMSQYSYNTTQNTSVITWQTETSLPFNVSLHQIVMTKNYAYLLGGWDGTTNLNTIYRASINDSGIMGAWTNQGTLPDNISQSQALIIAGTLYLIGGRNNSGRVSTVYKCDINEDGTLGTWSLHNNLPYILALTQGIVTGNRVYLLGGVDATGTTNKTLYAEVDAEGVIGEWVQGPVLPGNISHSQAVLTKNRVYLLGGWNGSAVISTGITATIDQNGVIGTWSSITLPFGLTLPQVVVVRNRIYYIGTWVSSAPIDENGVIGTWVSTNNTPGTNTDSAKRGRQIVATSSRLYLVGGESSNGSAVFNNVFSFVFSGGKNQYFYNQVYTVSSHSGGKPWCFQYGINNKTNNLTTALVTGTTLPAARMGGQVIVTKNRAYLLGGHTGTTAVNTIYTAPIDSNGVVGVWTSSGSLPANSYSSQVVVTKTRVYLLGGWNGSSAYNNTYTAVINSDGTLGSWTAGTNLPHAIYVGQAIATKNRVYIVGGFLQAGPTSAVYSAPINADGTLGTWAIVDAIPGARYYSTIFITNNYVYLVGGYDGSYAVTNSVYRAPINSDGTLGSWVTYGTLPSTSSKTHAVVIKNKVYLLGGVVSGGSWRNGYTATIDENGNIGSWEALSDITITINEASVFITNSRLYIVGGVAPSGTTAQTVYLPFSGGVNDYMGFFGSSYLTAINPNTFKLPDITTGLHSAEAYIKF